jgi:chemotaxis protein MotA
MDFATITGLILGLGILVVSLLVGGVPVQTIIQPEAILIVFGGTLTALFINFSFEDIRLAFGSLSRAFHQEELTPEEVVDYLSDAAIYIRSRGLLAVQPLLSHVDIPFLQKGLQMIVDNQPTEHLRAQLTTELEVHYRKANQYAKVFESAGGFSPTMGIIGAIVGLIQIMGMLNSPEQLGHGIAAAFIATLYGVGGANLFLLPVAGKLKQRAKDDWFLKSMMLQGLVAIREGEHPTLIRERLQAYLDPTMTKAPRAQEQFDEQEQSGYALYPEDLVRV